MAIAMPASITGAAQTGFTAPTYTLSVDTPPDVNSKQSAVTAIGGTQTGVDAHSVARPFTCLAARPKQYATLGKPNPTTGLIGSVPRQTYKFLTRKGLLPLAGQPSQIGLARTEFEIPAGADTADPSNVRALVSAHIGFLSGISAGAGDTFINGVL